MLTLDDVNAARARISGRVRHTPLVDLGDTGLRLKAESLQEIGAFKIRGAFNALLSLTPEAAARGVVAHSSGNHAQAVACAAHRLGIKAKLVMPGNAPEPKVAGVRRWGGEIIFVGPAGSERAAKAAEIAAAEGLSLIEPFDDPRIMAGTGTIGLEILEAAPDAEVIFAPVSGGGLLGGLAAAVKLSAPGVRVIGVEPELADDAFQSFRSGERVMITAEEASRTSADGLRVQRLGALTWPEIRTHVDDIVTVTEAEIFAAMRRIAYEAHLVAEPSGAVAAAGALKTRAGAGAVAVVSGGNVDPAVFRAALGS